MQNVKALKRQTANIWGTTRVPGRGLCPPNVPSFFDKVTYKLEELKAVEVCSQKSLRIFTPLITGWRFLRH